ncbi:MAG: SIMPL domain-containing protein [Actinomycetota bacterium]|jgi:uncharacterized protein YggE|nr:SIMPL domain-containing protein [Actinomycetota bacterium]
MRSAGDGWARVGLAAAALVVVLGGAGAGAALASRAGGAIAGAATRRAGTDPPRCGGGAPTLTVTGRASLSITPDLLTVRLDVHTTAADASSALAQDNTLTAAVLHALSAGGVAHRDLQTTGLSIQPVYAATGQKVSGYGVDDTVVAKIRALSSAGTLIDDAVAAGGNATRIDSLSFSLTRPLRAQARARDEAVRQAVGDAKAMAAAANRRLGGICAMRDLTATAPTVSTVPIAFGAAALPNRAPVPLETGSETVAAQVRVVFALG